MTILNRLKKQIKKTVRTGQYQSCEIHTVKTAEQIQVDRRDRTIEIVQRGKIGLKAGLDYLAQR